MPEIKEIAKIESTMLGWEGHGILTCQLDLRYGSAGQSTPGFCLDAPVWEGEPSVGQFKGRVGTAYGMEFVCRVMKACGVTSWEQLPGKTIFALKDERYGPVLGIENLPTEPGSRFVFADLREETLVDL